MFTYWGHTFIRCDHYWNLHRGKFLTESSIGNKQFNIMKCSHKNNKFQLKSKEEHSKIEIIMMLSIPKRFTRSKPMKSKLVLFLSYLMSAQCTDWISVTYFCSLQLFAIHNIINSQSLGSQTIEKEFQIKHDFILKESHINLKLTLTNDLKLNQIQ